MVRPDLVAAPWSYGDARRALHYALMDRAPEMVRMMMRAVEEHSTRVGLPAEPFRLGETVLERGSDPLESDAEPWRRRWSRLRQPRRHLINRRRRTGHRRRCSR